MKNIISIHEFPWEYTAIQIWPEVKRCNYICSDCGIKISKFLNNKIEEGAYTARKWNCDMCGEEKYITSIRHYKWLN